MPICGFDLMVCRRTQWQRIKPESELKKKHERREAEEQLQQLRSKSLNMSQWPEGLIYKKFGRCYFLKWASWKWLQLSTPTTISNTLTLSLLKLLGSIQSGIITNTLWPETEEPIEKSDSYLLTTISLIVPFLPPYHVFYSQVHCITECASSCVWMILIESIWVSIVSNCLSSLLFQQPL